MYNQQNTLVDQLSPVEIIFFENAFPNSRANVSCSLFNDRQRPPSLSFRGCYWSATKFHKTDWLSRLAVRNFIGCCNLLALSIHRPGV